MDGTPMEMLTCLGNTDQWQAVLHLLEQAQRRLDHAVHAAEAADHSRLVGELVALACLTHMSMNVVRSMASPPAS